MAVFSFVSGSGQVVSFGLSADTKPAVDGGVYCETDTGKWFNRSGGIWTEQVKPIASTTGLQAALDAKIAVGQIPVIPITVTQSQTIPTESIALFADGTTFNSGVAIVFQGTARAIFIKQLQIV